MDRFVEILFLLMTLSLPSGVLAWLSLGRSAKQIGAQNKLKAFELRTKGRQHLTIGLIHGLTGPLGYYVVSRRVFPQIEAIWIVLILIMPTAVATFWFFWKLELIKRLILKEEFAARNPKIEQ